MADNEDLDEFESEEDVAQLEQVAQLEHPADSDGHDDEEEDEEEEEEDQPPVKKKKRQNLPLDWKEVKRWQRADY
jgi:hypothetical protein